MCGVAGGAYASGAACAEELPFAVRHGSREEAKIAVTIDDCYDIDSLRDAFALAQQYEVPVTVFPLGERIQPEDAELWQTIAASDWEIGSHTYCHTKIGRQDKYNLMFSLRKVQEQLDACWATITPSVPCGPPFGNYTDDQDLPVRCSRLPSRGRGASCALGREPDRPR